MFHAGAVQTGRRQLRARVLPQRLRLIHIGRGRNARVIAASGLLPGGVELRDGVLEQLHRCIIAAQREVIRGQLCLQRQPQTRQIGGAGLGARIGGSRHVAQPSEQIDLPGDIQVGDEVVAGLAGAQGVRRVLRLTAADRRGIGIHRGELRGVRLTGQRVRLLVARECGAQVRVRCVQLLLQLVELRIPEGLPPVRARLIVRGSRGRPIAGLLVGGNILIQLRRDIGGRERAGTEKCRERAADDEAFHDQAPVAGLVGRFTRTRS